MAVNDPLATEFLRESRHQMRACRDKIRHCVEQLDDDQLWHRPDERLNSIANLLLHLTGNMRQRLLALIGGEPDHRNRQSEFDERGPISKTELLGRFLEVVDRCDALLASLAGERLLETKTYSLLSGNVEGTAATLILHTLVHLGGHTQEIIAFTRLQLADRYRFLQQG